MRFRIKLTKSQWERLSEVISNLGTVSLVAFVIPYFSDQIDQVMTSAGLAISISMWYLSLVAARRY